MRTLDPDRRDDAAEPLRSGSAALLHTQDGRYLLQQRDSDLQITFPGHWCCFGGGIEPGESPAAALRRELREEIGYRARSLRLFTEMTLLLPFGTPRLERVLYFVVPFREAELASLRQQEGAAMALLHPEELALKDQFIPWDLAAVLMHARRTALFGTPRRRT